MNLNDWTRRFRSHKNHVRFLNMSLYDFWLAFFYLISLMNIWHTWTYKKLQDLNWVKRLKLTKNNSFIIPCTCSMFAKPFLFGFFCFFIERQTSSTWHLHMSHYDKIKKKKKLKITRKKGLTWKEVIRERRIAVV